MSDIWVERVAGVLAQKRLGTVLSLGRRGHGFVRALPEGSAQHVFQLEPVPKRFRELKRSARADQTFLACAFGPTDSKHMLREFTITSLAALRPATGLAKLFPGLRETGRIEVETCTAATLMAQIELHKKKPNLLILGAAGEEREAVRQFAALGLLDRFDYILTPLPHVGLYEGSSDEADLVLALEAQGFRTEERDDANPDDPLALLQRDSKWAELIKERDALTEQLEAAQKYKLHEAKLKEEMARLESQLVFLRSFLFAAAP